MNFKTVFGEEKKKKEQSFTNFYQLNVCYVFSRQEYHSLATTGAVG